MSQENVELSLRLIDAWNRRDVEATVALWDPEGVWYPSLEGIMEGSTYRGHAGVGQYFEDLAEFAEEGHGEFPEALDLGDKVLSLGHIRPQICPRPRVESRDRHPPHMARREVRRRADLAQPR